MPDFNPFDMDLDGDVDGIDFLGFDCLTRHVLQPDGEADDYWHGEDEADDDEHETGHDYEESEIDDDDDDSWEDELSDVL
jgi:hypothetical protein